MTYFALTTIIILSTSIIGILIGGIIERKGLPQKAIVTLSRPDGQRVTGQLDVSWSWTVYVFGIWALIFRGQILEFFMLFMVKLVFISYLATMLSGTFDPNNIQEIYYVEEVFKLMSTSQIVWWTVCWLIFGGVRAYYVAFANRNRIRAYHAKGCDFSKTPDMEKLFEFAGLPIRRKPEEMAQNERAGQTHDFVVPDSQVEAEKEDLNDYSNLTVTDLKLLLKSEGVPFPSNATKDQLLELIDENVEKH